MTRRGLTAPSCPHTTTTARRLQWFLLRLRASGRLRICSSCAALPKCMTYRRTQENYFWYFMENFFEHGGRQGAPFTHFSATPQRYVLLAEEIRSAIASEMPVLSRSEAASRFPIVHPLKDAHFAHVGRYEHYRPNCLILEAHPHEADSFFQDPHAFLSDREFLDELAERVIREFLPPDDEIKK